MKKQTKMIHRLVDIKERASEAAETAHVVAHQASQAAEGRLREAIGAWTTFAQSTPEVTSVHDLEDRDRQYKWLRKQLEDAEKSVQIARAEESAKREKMTEARIELRRYETWLENTTELAKMEAKRVQALADDEVAARKRSAAQ